MEADLTAIPQVLEGSGEITTLMTPAMARWCLSRNIEKNRKLNKEYVNALVRTIRAGGWTYDGTPIKFDVRGCMYDGQHRLTAILQAGVPVLVKIVWGLPVSAHEFVDSGRSRSATDALSMKGYANSKDISALIRFVLAWDDKEGVKDFGNTRVTNAEAVAVADADPDIAEVMRIVVGSNYRATFRGTAIPAFFLWLMAKRNCLGPAVEFLDSVKTLEHMGKDDPRLVLARWFIGARVHTTAERVRAVAVIIKAWNAYVTSTPIHLLRHAISDRFPMPIKMPFIPRQAADFRGRQ